MEEVVAFFLLFFFFFHTLSLSLSLLLSPKVVLKCGKNSVFVVGVE